MRKQRKPLIRTRSSAKQFEPVPLDLLCNMAWRLLQKEAGEGDEETAWSHCLVKADKMIRSAKEMQNWTVAFNQSESEYQERVLLRRDEIVSTLTAHEQEELWVSYERGCQIITGLKKKQDAVRKFEAINSRTDISEQTTRQLRLKGFGLQLVAECQEIYESMDPETRKKFRKPYEKSGDHTRGAKEGRKKIQGK